MFIFELEPYDGNYPYSLKDLFMRVYTGYIQILFILSSPVPQSETGLFCEYYIEDKSKQGQFSFIQ